MEKNAFYEQLNAIQSRLPKGEIVVVMGDLTAKLGSDNNLLGHVTGKHGPGDRNGNGGRFEDFCNFRCLAHWHIIEGHNLPEDQLGLS